MKQYPFLTMLLSSTIILFIILGLEQFTDMDIYLQKFFYDDEAKQWLFTDKEHKGLYGKIFYYDFKNFLIASAIVALLLAIYLRYKRAYSGYIIALVKYILALIFIPLFISLLKASTNVYCPDQLAIFNGTLPYLRVFDSYPTIGTYPQGRCFPGGHATAGSLFLILFYCLQDIKLYKYRWYGFGLGIVLGFITGTYQMARGVHFFSHTLTTLILSWILVCLINQGIIYISKKYNVF